MSQRMLVASWWAVVLVGVLGFKLVHDTDIFWQVRLGQIMLEEGVIRRCDPFTYTHPNDPAPPIGWLAQVLFAALYHQGGWHLARAVHQVALAGSLLVAAATCRRDATSPFSVIFAMTVAFIVMLPNADFRPQSFALLGFATLVALARGRLPFAVKLLGALAILVIWQNMHPSLVIGMVAMGALAAAAFLGRKSDQGKPWELVVLALLAMVLQFATPLGARIVDVSRANLRISRDVLRNAEWLPPWDPEVVFEAVSVYWLVLLGTAIAVSLFWRRLSASDRALFFAMTILSLYATRFIVFWAVALVPLWAEVVERLIPGGMFAWARGPGDRAVRAIWSWPALALGLAIAVGLQPARSGPVFRPEITLDGVRALRAELPGAARIYNHYGWAGPLLLEGRPEWRVAVDGRLYFFSDPAEWQSMEDARAGRIPLDEVERRHHPDAFFLYPGGNRALVEALSACPRWRSCFSGPTCVAFVRSR